MKKFTYHAVEKNNQWILWILEKCSAAGVVAKGKVCHIRLGVSFCGVA